MKFLPRSNFSSEADYGVYNKIAWRLLPFLLLLYIVSFLDRVNVGFAKLQMAPDIGLSDAAYGFAAGIFFLGYCLCEVPSNLVLQRVGAKFWIARIMVVWGVISTGMMLVRTPTEFYVMRFLLGVAEAGFYPGIVLYLTYWYPVRLRSQVCALFFLGIAISGVIGGPLSGWVMSNFAGMNGWKSWQWLFLLEGAPAILLGVATFFYLDDGPAKAKWLTDAERSIVTGELRAEDEAMLAAGAGHRFLDAIKSVDVWYLALADFALLTGVYGVSFWLPQIVKDLHVTDLFENGLITAIPFAIACVGMVLIGRHSDRNGERRWHTVWCGVIGAGGLLLSGAFSTSPYLSLLGLSIAMTGALGGLAVLWSLPGALLSGAAAAAGFALIAMIGNLSGFLSPFGIGMVKSATGQTVYGLYAMAVVMIAGSLLMLRLPRATATPANDRQRSEIAMRMAG